MNPKVFYVFPLLKLNFIKHKTQYKNLDSILGYSLENLTRLFKKTQNCDLLVKADRCLNFKYSVQCEILSFIHRILVTRLQIYIFCSRVTFCKHFRNKISGTN